MTGSDLADPQKAFISKVQNALKISKGDLNVLKELHLRLYPSPLLPSDGNEDVRLWKGQAEKVLDGLKLFQTTAAAAGEAKLPGHIEEEVARHFVDVAQQVRVGLYAAASRLGQVRRVVLGSRSEEFFIKQEFPDLLGRLKRIEEASISLGNGAGNWRTVLLGASLAFTAAAVTTALGTGSAAQAKEQIADPGQTSATAGVIAETRDSKSQLDCPAGTRTARDHTQFIGVSL